MKILLILIVILALINAIAWLVNWNTEKDPRQQLFQAGTVPTVEPDGFHERNMPNYSGAWQGKKFDASTDRGVNIFKEGDQTVERYPFKTAIAKSLSVPDKKVFQINYDLPSNSPWLRLLVDEMVKQSDGSYLGKIHLRLLWMKTAIGWFSLK